MLRWACPGERTPPAPSTGARALGGVAGGACLQGLACPLPPVDDTAAPWRTAAHSCLCMTAPPQASPVYTDTRTRKVSQTDGNLFFLLEKTGEKQIFLKVLLTHLYLICLSHTLQSRTFKGDPRAPATL